jgi:hypothetical protein
MRSFYATCRALAVNRTGSCAFALAMVLLSTIAPSLVSVDCVPRPDPHREVVAELAAAELTGHQPAPGATTPLVSSANRRMLRGDPRESEAHHVGPCKTNLSHRRTRRAQRQTTKNESS